jgi:hypothetical protein
MHHLSKVRVRGIYATALTGLLLAHGFTIVDPSPTIQVRFEILFCDAPADVRLCDRQDRHGIMIDGEHEHATAVVECLQNVLPHMLCVLHPHATHSPQEAEEIEADPLGVPPVRYRAEFPATVKARLDHLRGCTMPTTPGHHALKIVDADAVDAAEVRLAADPSQRAALGQQLREALVLCHLQPGLDLPVCHIKAGRSPVTLWGRIARRQADTLVLIRHFQGGGMYDGLRLPKAAGDWGTMELTAGAWVTVHRYFRRSGALVGKLYNIGTPVEFYPDHLRYVDLELDVVCLPDGTSRLEDTGVLMDTLARGRLPLALGQEARRLAATLLRQLNAADA